MKITFIGFGNMATALAKGFISAGRLQPQDITACAARFDVLRKRAEALGINAVQTPLDAVRAGELVMVAVKPNQVNAVLSPIRGKLEGKTVVCIAAGWDFARLEALVGASVHHISIVPNTPVEVCAGIIAAEDKHSLSRAQYALFEEALGSVGLIETVRSEQLSVAGTVAGCAPAYAAMFIEALGDAGVKHGLSRETAYRLAAKMLEGTGKLCIASGAHPAQMKDAVCSPGGTTIKGVAALENRGFRAAIIAAVDAAQGE